jgi:hypothetical protein
MRPFIALALIALVLSGCKKSHTAPSTTTPPNQPPAVTAQGTPTGTPITKTIGPAGGTVLSADGRVELDFPPNAVTTNTDISIQPGTNTAPNGTGVSYHFMPDGTTFAVPVTLTFHYTASDVNGTNPFFFFIATQDSTGVWQADFKNRAIDTVARTASLSIGHFSWWTLGSQCFLFSAPVQVSENQTSSLFATNVNDEGDPNPNTGGEFSMSPEPAETPVPYTNISDWAVNGTPGGNAQNGTLSGTESSETFTAPSLIDKERMVQVSGSIATGSKGWNKGKQVLQTSKFIVFDNIDLLPQDLIFDVGVSIRLNKESGLINDVYFDTASFQVEIKAGVLKVFAPYYNVPATEDPSMGSVGTVQGTWQNDGYGLINITEVTGLYVTADSVVLFVDHENTSFPTWNFLDISDGDTWSVGGGESPGYPGTLVFLAKDTVQGGMTYSGTGAVFQTWSVTPVH